MPSGLRLTNFNLLIPTENEECLQDKISCYLCDYLLIKNICTFFFARNCAKHKHTMLTKVYSLVGYGVHLSVFAVKLHGKPGLTVVKIDRNYHLDNVAQCLVWAMLFWNNSLLALDLETFEILLQTFSLHHVEMCLCVFAPLIMFLNYNYVNIFIFSLEQKCPFMKKIIEYSSTWLELHIYCLIERNSWVSSSIFWFSLLLTLWGQQTLSLNVGNFIPLIFKFIRNVLPCPSTIETISCLWNIFYLCLIICNYNIVTMVHRITENFHQLVFLFLYTKINWRNFKQFCCPYSDILRCENF